MVTEYKRKLLEGVLKLVIHFYAEPHSVYKKILLNIDKMIQKALQRIGYMIVYIYILISGSAISIVLKEI